MMDYEVVAYRVRTTKNHRKWSQWRDAQRVASMMAELRDLRSKKLLLAAQVCRLETSEFLAPYKENQLWCWYPHTGWFETTHRNWYADSCDPTARVYTRTLDEIRCELAEQYGESMLTIDEKEACRLLGAYCADHNGVEHFKAAVLDFDWHREERLHERICDMNREAAASFAANHDELKWRVPELNRLFIETHMGVIDFTSRPVTRVIVTTKLEPKYYMEPLF